MHAERLDALVTFAGLRQEPARHADGRGPARTCRRCSSTAARSCPATTRTRRSTSCSVFEAVGACAAGTHHRERARRDRDGARARPRGRARACSPPTRWRRSARRSACRCPGSASPPAVDRRRDDFAYESGRAVMHLLELDLRPRQIMTKEAFENAIAVTMALGGSTNAVLHLLAIAQRGARRARARRLQPRRRARPAHRRHEAARQVPHGRPRPRRWRAGRDEDAARRGAAARRLPHGHRQDDGREPRRRSTRPAPDGEVVHPLDRARSTRRAASRSCAARSRRRVRS